MTELFTVHTPPAAWARFVEHFQPPRRSERIATADALERVLAEQLVAPQDLPEFARATVDGYAVAAADTFGATPGLPAFLDLDLPGSKVVVGDGPARASLERHYPAVTFTGALFGEALARAYASADVFVFPSRTDTFGNVLLEALSSGLPVAAYPVMGPIDIVGGTGAGVLDENLGRAALAALDLDREAARQLALQYSWRRAAEQFLVNVRVANGEARPADWPPITQENRA